MCGGGGGGGGQQGGGKGAHSVFTNIFSNLFFILHENEYKSDTRLLCKIIRSEIFFFFFFTFPHTRTYFLLAVFITCTTFFSRCIRIHTRVDPGLFNRGFILTQLPYVLE